MIRIRTMTVRDIPLGLRLARQAGWNQTEADWRRFLDLEPEGCFVGELDGALPAPSVADTLELEVQPEVQLHPVPAPSSPRRARRRVAAAVGLPGGGDRVEERAAERSASP